MVKESKSKESNKSRRVAQVEAEVQRIVANYLISQLRGEISGLVTVSRVLMPADLRAAKIYVSFMGIDKSVDEAIEILQEHAVSIQNNINKQLRMRYCPKITFFEDKSSEKILKVDRILHDLKQKKSEVSEEDSE